MDQNWSIFSFFMSFPLILIVGTNISLIFFIKIFKDLRFKLSYYLPKKRIQWMVFTFMIGSIVSVFSENSTDNLGLARGLVVLPNYIYWCLMIILLIHLRKTLNYMKMAKPIFWGLLLSILYFEAQDYLPKMPLFLNSISPNSLSFLTICFTAPAIVYLLEAKKKTWAIIVSVFIILILLSLGRRAGFALTLLSTVAAVSLSKIDIPKIIVGLTLFFGLQFLVQTDFVKEFFYEQSPRIHKLIYENDNIIEEDRSYLVRRLMVEKALIIFESQPLTGIGLNSFAEHKVNFRGDFEGSQYVVNKKKMNEKSAHNSYASLLAEGGLLIFVPFLFILLYNCYHFIRHFNQRSRLENSLYWAFLAMTIHLYFISAILNVYAWFLIGLVSSLSVLYQEKKALSSKKMQIIT